MKKLLRQMIVGTSLENCPVEFSARVLRDARVIFGGGPATRSALSATGASLREIRCQIHR